MAKSEGGGGLMSSAGLVRYFESEDRNAISLDPRTVVAWGALFGVLMQVLNAVGLGTQGAGSVVLAVIVAAFGGITIGMIVRAAMQGEV